MTSNDDDQLRPTSAERLLDEAESLIWALLDDHLEAADATRLCRLIEKDAAVRARYMDCVQLHVDLREHFGAEAAERPAKPAGQVLPNLLLGMPLMDGISQRVD